MGNEQKYRIWKERELKQRLKRGGYELDRYHGSHKIYKNGDGNTIVIPRSLNPMLIRRIIKENKL